MSYKITIEETKTLTKETGKEWKVIGQVQKEKDGYVKPNADPYYLADEYGYTPLIQKEVTETKKIYEQEVTYMDLTKVIKSINGID